jgi:hypothetical protein
MILVSDGVAEVSREIHAGELRTMGHVFADVKTADEVIELLGWHIAKVVQGPEVERPILSGCAPATRHGMPRCSIEYHGSRECTYWKKHLSGRSP